MTVGNTAGNANVQASVNGSTPTNTGLTVNVENPAPTQDPANPGKPKFTSINILSGNGTDLPGRTSGNFGNASRGQRVRIEILGLEYTNAPSAGATCDISLINSSGNVINNAFASVDGSNGDLTTIKGNIQSIGGGKYKCMGISSLGADITIQNNIKARFVF
jgi:hypothetical protein